MSLAKFGSKSATINPLSQARSMDYFSLLKPRVMSLVVFTAFVGLIIAPGTIHPLLGFLAILCIAVGGGASGALNMWYDSDIDAIMKRTRGRAVPSGRIHRDHALFFGLALSLFSVVLMGVFIHWFAAALLAFTIFFYVVIYTIGLKRFTPQNIVIGGAAGAFPPMIGEAAVTGTVSLEGFILFLIIFLWTPPHFWALSLFVKMDYEDAGIPMMPNVKGEKSTKIQIFIYAILMSVAGVFPWILHFAGNIYGGFSVIAGLIFVLYSWRLLYVPDGVKTIAIAKQLFFYSLFYLTAIFSLLLIENLWINFFL